MLEQALQSGRVPVIIEAPPFLHRAGTVEAYELRNNDADLYALLNICDNTPQMPRAASVFVLDGEELILIAVLYTDRSREELARGYAATILGRMTR